ncbi:MAG: hypothetical protein MUF18_15845 [Fimbriiglobus sp.]|nr:hypothetical protein [Fimbriiglobus sp.]
MLVLESGFRRVRTVALGPGGAVAAQKGSLPFPGSFYGLSQSEQRRVLDDAVWEAKLWPALDAEPSHDTDGTGSPFGMAIDFKTGQILHGNASGTFHWPGGELALDSGPLRCFEITPDGTRIVCGTERYVRGGRGDPEQLPSRLIALVRRKHGWAAEVTHDGDGYQYEHLAFFPDGQRLAALEWSRRARGNSDIQGTTPTLSVHDAATLRPLAVQRFTAPADGLAVCGERVVVLARPALLKIWECPDLAGPPIEVSVAEPVTALAADPLGRFVLTASGAVVRVWDANTWAVTRSFDWQAGEVTCLTVALEGLTAAAGTSTGKVVVWDVD